MKGCVDFIQSVLTMVSAAGVGAITLMQKQVAASMVTGVFYSMASK